MNKDKMHPESLMMSHGYDPELSEGAVKCPVFQTSTFVLNTPIVHHLLLKNNQQRHKTMVVEWYLRNRQIK